MIMTTNNLYDVDMPIDYTRCSTDVHLVLEEINDRFGLSPETWHHRAEELHKVDNEPHANKPVQPSDPRDCDQWFVAN